MSDKTDNENEMGNIVSGGKDILHSIVPGPEGNQEKKTEELHSDNNSTSAESEPLPEQPSRSDQQQSTGNRKDGESKDTNPSSSELQHDGSTDSSRGDGNTGEESSSTSGEHCCCGGECDCILWNFIKRQQDAWDKLATKDKEDMIIVDENTRVDYPSDEECISLVDMFVINPNVLKVKNRDNKKKKSKKNKKKWFGNKKSKNGKVHYIIF